MVSAVVIVRPYSGNVYCYHTLEVYCLIGSSIA